MPRGHHNRMNKLNRPKLVNPAFEEGRIHQLLAQQLGVARQTARNIIIEYVGS